MYLSKTPIYKQVGPVLPMGKVHVAAHGALLAQPGLERPDCWVCVAVSLGLTLPIPAFIFCLGDRERIKSPAG